MTSDKDGDPQTAHLQTAEWTAFQGYGHDLGHLVTGLALEAKADYARDPDDFRSGYLMGLHAVLSLMQSQAEVFGLSREAVGVARIDADGLL